MKSRNLWHGLLFLQGHLADADLARSLADAPAPSPKPAQEPAGVLGHVLYLGGRPMHAGHNFDVEEPFDDLQGTPSVEPVRHGTAPSRAPEQPVAC